MASIPGRTWIVASLAMAVLSCQKKAEPGRPQDTATSENHGFRKLPLNGLGLRNLSLDELLGQGILTFNPSLQTPTFNKSLFDALNAGAAYSLQLGLNDQGVSRVDSFRFNQELTPVRIVSGGMTTIIPFQIAKGESIQFVRIFKSPSEAASAKPPSLFDLPTNAEKALALPEGNSVIIPTESKVVVGAPLQFAGHLHGLPVTAGLSALAVLDGSFRIEVTRAKGTLVRVRIAERSSEGIALGAQLGLGGPRALRILFFSKGFNNAAEISAEFCRGVRFLSDYELDLANPRAREAFDSALSGAVVLSGADRIASPWKLAGEAFSDFSDLEAASLRRGTGVIQRSSVLDHYASSKSTLSINSPIFSYGIESGFTRNRFTLETEGAPPIAYAATAHVFGIENRTAIFRGTDKKASGFIAPESQLRKGLPGSHWFQWRRSDGGAATTQMILDELRNTLAPRWGIIPQTPQSYPSTEPATVSFRVVISESALESLFDPAKTTVDTLAIALSSMARTFDAKFIIPYNQMPYSISSTSPIATAAVNAACDAVSQQWGRWYCGFFTQSFIPEILALQRGSSAEQKATFFKRFYTNGSGLNLFGGQVLVRYLSEVASLQDIPQGVAAEAILTWPAPHIDERIPPAVFRVGQLPFPEALGFLASAIGF